MGPKGNDLARASCAGTSSGDGGGGGGGDATPPSPPRLPLAPPPAPPSRDPSALAASPPPLQPPGPPSRAAADDEDMDEVPDDEEEDPEEEDDYLLEEEDPREEDPKEVWNWEREEAEYDYGPLEKEEEPKEQDDGGWNWEQTKAEYWGHLEEGEVEHDAASEELEEGEIRDDQAHGENLIGSSESKFFSTHVDHPVVNGGFRRPRDYPSASVGLQEPISKLILECSHNDIIQEKIKILSKQYGLFRGTQIDSRCFYRAFLFSYLENLGRMRDRQAEVIRLMECVEVSIQRFCQLQWREAYLSNSDKYFLSLVYEFYSLINSVANGLTSDKLYERSLEEISSGRIIPFLRLLTEIEIRTQNINKLYVPEEIVAVEFCRKQVRCPYAEAGAVQMRALTYALSIPLRVEIVDMKKWIDEPVRVKRLDFFRESDPGKGRVHIVRSYYSSSTAHKPLKRGSGDELLSSDDAPMLTLLSRHDHCDILYPK